MDELGSISITQILAFVLVNTIGLFIIGITLWLFQLQTPKTIEKIGLSIGLGFVVMGIVIVIMMNLGIYFWIKSGDYHSAMIMIPITICGIPIIVPVCVVGMYIQLVYRDKIQGITNDIAQGYLDKKNMS